ncbi:ketose-bisphosphate aldolase [Maribellus comscasis]|uniref:Ketose-bisphosphate aldolase n=1 Tax=Maribellus comscasis TaxID=2681766 RepID=A0A6I6JV72_9BACT|nr:class II fructose-bisphosphate aldolase [Maribellus comscasis]QGY44052.1 ketose-bisphosphate aldolase [Maribellus comscasis]
MLVSTSELFKKCYGRYGIAAVNVWDMEQIHGLFAAAQKANSPFIIQTTPVARNYASSEMLIAMISAAAKIYPKTVFAIHLDHGNKEHAFQSILSGDYTSVMIDASHEPFDENVKITKEIVEEAHKKSISVEAELGVLSGVEDDLVVDEKNKKYTQPDEVVEFVEQAGCDSLAVAVGTSHGAYKFSGKQGLQFDILEEIQQKLPGFPLVLHGGSAVNKDEIQRINAAGGQLGIDAKGVSDKEIIKAIQFGVCKINIATDARLIWTRVVREFFKYSPAQFDPIVPGKSYMEAFEKFCIKKFELFKSTGKASEFKS